MSFSKPPNAADMNVRAPNSLSGALLSIGTCFELAFACNISLQSISYGYSFDSKSV
jgi:hypothetical protein